MADADISRNSRSTISGQNWYGLFSRNHNKNQWASDKSWDSNRFLGKNYLFGTIIRISYQ